MGGWLGGWMAGLLKNKAISASNKVEVEVEAELGNIVSFLLKHPDVHLEIGFYINY